MKARKLESKANSGSPRSGEPEYLLVGHLRRPHGLLGDLLMEIQTDFPERLKPGAEVYVGSRYQKRLVVASRPHAGRLLIRFEGLDSPESVGMLRNTDVFVLTVDRPPLRAGQVYHHQLLGSAVVDEHGVRLGELTEIIRTGANDVLVIRRPLGGELLLPAIGAVILETNVSNQVIRVRVPPGLE